MHDSKPIQAFTTTSPADSVLVDTSVEDRTVGVFMVRLEVDHDVRQTDQGLETRSKAVLLDPKDARTLGAKLMYAAAAAEKAQAEYDAKAPSRAPKLTR